MGFTNALFIGTNIIERAGIVVIAGDRVVRMDTGAITGAGVVSAGVGVITAVLGRLADPSLAGITVCACLAIIAGVAICKRLFVAFEDGHIASANMTCVIVLWVRLALGVIGAAAVDLIPRTDTGSGLVARIREGTFVTVIAAQPHIRCKLACSA